MEKVTYTKCGKMNYHPEFHPNHKQPFTEEEIEYLCKFYETDGAKTISLALGRTEKTVSSKYGQLKRAGLIDMYKKLKNYV